MEEDKLFKAVLQTINLNDEFFKLPGEVRKQKGRMLKLWYNLQPDKEYRYDKCICNNEAIIEIFEIVTRFIETKNNKETTE